jgi:hypothetical protein
VGAGGAIVTNALGQEELEYVRPAVAPAVDGLPKYARDTDGHLSEAQEYLHDVQCQLARFKLLLAEMDVELSMGCYMGEEYVAVARAIACSMTLVVDAVDGNVKRARGRLARRARGKKGASPPSDVVAAPGGAS